MKKILLIGKDPIFAWALQKKVSAIGYKCEHVYTLPEAQLRMSRFDYKVVLLDGVGNQNIDLLLDSQHPGIQVFLLEDFDDSDPVLKETIRNKVRVLSKESAIPHIISSLNL